MPKMPAAEHGGTAGDDILVADDARFDGRATSGSIDALSGSGPAL
jgi:hypothetical protein